jgi:anti-sigma regulatory factor (Ser/Thr protein kinase)
MKSIAVKEISAIGEVRHCAIELAKNLNFPEIEIANMAIIANEATNNLIKHTTSGGEIILDAFRYDSNHVAINLLALDKGPGIINIEECLKDGYSTTKTQGTGLGAIQRLSTNFDVYTIPGLGTALWSQIVINFGSHKAEKINKNQFLQNEFWDIGSICIPVWPEKVCGDGWAIEIMSDNLQALCLVVDGLGHGEGAHEASNEAIKIFNSHKDMNLPIETLFQKIHDGLRQTRGAAAAIAKLDLMRNELEYVGIGNLSAALFSKSKRESLASLNGIVGHGIKKIQPFTYSLPNDFILCMYSDGLITHWEMEKYIGLLDKPTKIIAGVLYRDYIRKKDDVTITILKRNHPEP